MLIAVRRARLRCIATKCAPPDPETVAAVIATAEEFVACINAADFPRLFALLTGTGLWQVGETPPFFSEEDVRAIYAAAPEDFRPSLPATLVAVTDVATLDDGRVGAFAVPDDPTAAPRLTTGYLIFARSGERWLIDESLDFEVEAAA
jgi:hypothetical protein